jgi:hypothetical protein
MQWVRSIKNQYLGVNAHLHSRWQAQYGWHEFHAAHIVDLTRSLKTQLMPMGYTAGIQDSLQIRRSDFREGRPTSDVAIYALDPVRSLMPAGVAVADPTDAMLTIPDLLIDYEELREWQAIGLYRSQSGREESDLVAWIELLSPSNKLNYDDLIAYRRKRLHLLGSGVVFVELDYLHESPPTISKIPNYSVGRRKHLALPNAHPYHIIVIDPRPEFEKGKVHPYSFDADAPFPLTPIPLCADDLLRFDFGAPYHKTLAETFFAFEQVDYRQLPDNFDRYHPADQTRIAARMVAVLQAAQRGVDLETGPFPTPAITLEAALTQIEMLTHA